MAGIVARALNVHSIKYMRICVRLLLAGITLQNVLWDRVLASWHCVCLLCYIRCVVVARRRWRQVALLETDSCAARETLHTHDCEHIRSHNVRVSCTPEHASNILVYIEMCTHNYHRKAYL